MSARLRNHQGESVRNEMRTCLPLDHVLRTVLQVESELVSFYERAAGQTTDHELASEFHLLEQTKRDSALVVAEVCREADCGVELLDKPSEDDLHFLSALAQSSFYRQAGNISELLHPSLTSLQLCENALRLERDLMLFYTKFYSVSCAAQRAIFQKVINRCQNDIMALVNLRTRLQHRD